jgi:hypothetical protein
MTPKKRTVTEVQMKSREKRLCQRRPGSDSVRVVSVASCRTGLCWDGEEGGKERSSVDGGGAGEEGSGNGWLGFGSYLVLRLCHARQPIMTHLDVAYVNDCAHCTQREEEPESSHFPISSDWPDTHMASTVMRYM